MKSFILVLAGIAVGVLLSLVFAPALLGAGAGAGIVTGYKAGICATVEAARNKGLIAAGQVDEVLSGAEQILSSTSSEMGKSMLIQNAAECTRFIDDIRKTGQKLPVYPALMTNAFFHHPAPINKKFNP